MRYDYYTFSECISLASRFMNSAFDASHEKDIVSNAAKASRLFIAAETARADGNARLEAYYRQNYL